jgi:hypothetical protein
VKGIRKLPENSLSLSYEPEDSWHGHLKASVEADGFKGHGSAWFSVDRLRAFVIAMDALPISAGSEPKLEGGQWGEKGVEQVHLGLRIVPFDGTGTLQVQCTFAEPTQSNASAFTNSLRLAFLIEYGDLQRFRASLTPLLDAKSASAVLHAPPS